MDVRKFLLQEAFSGKYDGFNLEFNVLEIIESAKFILKNQDENEFIKDHLVAIKSLIAEIETEIE